MTNSTVLGIPYLASQQATPEIPHNFALYMLEAMLRGVKAIQNAPPGGPADGDTYIVGTAGSGAWLGKNNCVAIYASNAWRFVPGFDTLGAQIAMGAAQEGMQLYNQATDRQYVWTGDAWVALLGTAGGAAPFVQSGAIVPVFTFTTPGNLSVSYAIQTGAYFRIWDLVYINVRLQFTPTHTTAAGEARITGFPFNATLDSGFTLSSTLVGTTWPAGRTQMSPTIRNGEMAAEIRSIGSGVAGAQLGVTEFTSGVAHRLFFNGIYQR